MTEKWNNFEHKIWELLKSSALEQSPTYLLAISGGLDSMVLLEVMKRLRPSAKLRIAHFHHGESKNTQSKFRDEALEFVKHKVSLAESFFTEKFPGILLSEAEMRDERWNFLRKIRLPNEPILTAHHLDDWAETALLKMIRGSSLQGIASFQIWNQEIFRPFLRLHKVELFNYANLRQLDWIDDPSNKSEDYLRNWVREKWLKDLELKQPGGVDNLTRSLLQIVDDFRSNSTFVLVFFKDLKTNGLDRTWFLALSRDDQLKAIALYLKTLEIHEFTRGQLQEIIKRLDKNQKDLTFVLFGRKWVINATQIMLE